LGVCMQALLGSTQYSAVVVPHTLSYEFGLSRIQTFNEVASHHGKIVCNVWMSEWVGGPGTEESERSSSVALFRSMQGCMATLAAWHARAAALSRANDEVKHATHSNRAEQVAKLLA